MKKSNWLTDIMIEKLQTISRDVSLRFGDHLKGRGHWEEIEFMRRSFPYGGGRSSINVKKPAIRSSVLKMRRRNCNEEPTTFPMFVLKYDSSICMSTSGPMLITFDQPLFELFTLLLCGRSLLF